MIILSFTSFLLSNGEKCMYKTLPMFFHTTSERASNQSTIVCLHHIIKEIIRSTLFSTFIDDIAHVWKVSKLQDKLVKPIMEPHDFRHFCHKRHRVFLVPNISCSVYNLVIITEIFILFVVIFRIFIFIMCTVRG